MVKAELAEEDFYKKRCAKLEDENVFVKSQLVPLQRTVFLTQLQPPAFAFPRPTAQPCACDDACSAMIPSCSAAATPGSTMETQTRTGQPPRADVSSSAARIISHGPWRLRGVTAFHSHQERVHHFRGKRSNTVERERWPPRKSARHTNRSVRKRFGGQRDRKCHGERDLFGREPCVHTTSRGETHGQTRTRTQITSMRGPQRGSQRGPRKSRESSGSRGGGGGRVLHNNQGSATFSMMLCVFCWIQGDRGNNL